MPITTTDVITNAVSGIEVIKNGSSIVYCWRGVPISGSGNYQSMISPFEYNKTYSYDAIESRLENRFDDVRYYSGDTAG